MYTNDTTKSSFFEFAERHGLALFPIQRGQKLPHGIVPSFAHDWAKAPEQWVAWRNAHNCNFGIVAFASRLVIVDIDVAEIGFDAWNYWSDWCTSHGLPVYTPYCTSARGGWHVAFSLPGDFDISTLRQVPLIGPIEGVSKKAVIDLRIKGYVVAPGSYYDGTARGEESGNYKLLPNAQVHPAPDALLAACARKPRVSGTARAGTADANDTAKVLEWMAEHDCFASYDQWREVGMILRSEFSDDPGFSLWQITNDGTCSAVSESAKWESFAADPRADGVGIGTLMHRAHEAGCPHHIRKSTAAMFAGVAEIAAAAGATLLPPLPYGPLAPGLSLMTRGESLPADSEDSLALSFADLHADDLRYVEEWGRWMHWNGQSWTPDKTSSGYDMVRKHLRKFAGGLAYQDARKVATAKTVAAVERMARTDRRIVTTGDIWDADTMLLNTPGGVVDLLTGKMQKAQPSDHLTKMTTVAPGGDCPTWLAFLDKSLAGDADLIAFVQRVLGYALTGDTREHALFFMYGQGGNGKGVLLNTVAGIMGDYQRTAPVETFIDSPHERHPTDLAGLRGARLVTASETEKGRRWAEAKIKMLTGGDRIAARFMRQDFFEFVPQFKLVIAGNHKPSLRSVDAAMRRRMHLIPFTVNIPESERDTTLPERLKAEWSGILAWLIEGCLAWQQSGLQPPAAVRAATDEYLASEDVLGSWLVDRCDVTAGAWASRNELFGSWSSWANGAREYIGTQKQFLEAMRQHGFEEGGRVGVRGFRGVQMKPTPLPPLPC